MKRTLGTCCYHEHWPREIWREDACRMVEDDDRVGCLQEPETIPDFLPSETLSARAPVHPGGRKLDAFEGGGFGSIVEEKTHRSAVAYPDVVG